MPRYSVVLFLEKETGTNIGQRICSQRVQNEFIKAKSADEALGLMIRNTKREFHDWPVVYHLVKEIPR